jgi:hypothetical protein
MAWNCAQCGERIRAKYTFCWHCGSPNVLPRISKTDRNLTLKDFANYARSRPKRFIFYSIALGLAALIVLLILVNGILFIIEEAKEEGLSVFSLSMFAFYLGIFILLLRRSKRYMINSQKILLKDARSPILYLRAFLEETDAVGAYRDGAKSDETLALALKNVGPLVAVGKPGDNLQPLGAVRLYFDHDEWQENIEALMSLSQLVIIQAGYSSKLDQSGLEWEMLTAMKELKPEQLVYSFLSWQELSKRSRQHEYEIFAMQYRRVTGRDLPELIGGAYFLYFDQDWRPCLSYPAVWQRDLVLLKSPLRLIWKTLTYRFNREPRSAYDATFYFPIPAILKKTSVLSVREALRPILGKQGIKSSY